MVHAADFETLLIRLKDVLERLAKWNLRVNGAKTILGSSECTFLGHTVDGAGHKHTEKRVEALQAMRAPTDKGQLRGGLSRLGVKGPTGSIAVKGVS